MLTGRGEEEEEEGEGGEENTRDRSVPDGSDKYKTNLLIRGAYLLFCVECTKADDGKLPDIARRIKEKLTQCLATAALW